MYVCMYICIYVFLLIKLLVFGDHEKVKNTTVQTYIAF